MGLQAISSSFPMYYNSETDYERKKEMLLTTYDRQKEFVVGGTVLCKVCREPRLFDDPERRFISRCACGCLAAENRRNAELTARKERAARFKSVQNSLSDLGQSYERASFRSLDLSSADEAYIRAAERCEKFCLNFAAVRSSGRGIWLYGDTGVGKTHLAACIHHLLEKENRTSVYTSAGRILEEIRASYNKAATVTERSISDALCEADVLIVDNVDQVARRSAEAWDFAVRKLSEIITARFSELKPTVLLSRFSIAGFAGKKFFPDDVMDRIAARQVEIRLIGENRFRQPPKNNIEF